MAINIQLPDGRLEVYEDTIEWSWTAVRFSDGIRDPYSNDFTLPKTTRNIDLLNASGLLDSYTQPLGTQISPCVMTIGSHVIDAYLQVVSVSKEEITICLYEKLFPNNVLDNSITSYVVDDDSSIYVWNVNSYNAYPNTFRKYWYGMGYNSNYAQYHPSKDLNEVIQRVNAGAGINMPLSPSNKYAIATKKTVCPQNKIQVIEGYWTSDSGNFAVLSGGQHITNDCEFSYSPDSTTITFNRACKVNGKLYYSFKKKTTVSNNFPFYVNRYVQGQPVFSMTYNIPSNNYASYVVTDNYQATMPQGSELRVMCNNTNKYDMLNFVLVLTITDYNITEDDYGQELKYVGRTPRLKVWSDDGYFKFGSNAWQDYVDGNGGGYTYCWFDGTTYQTHYHNTGSPNSHIVQSFSLEWCSIAYFGYWCNLQDIKVKDLMWGTCWADGKKLVTGYIDNMNMIEKVLQYKDAKDTAIIQGIITETRISSDRLGKDNYILTDGQTHEQAEPISHIENQWLENAKDLHKSPFTYAPWRMGNWYCIDQYSNPKYDSDSGEYSCDFNEVDGFAVANAGSTNTLLYKLTINTMDFERMTQSVEVDIETYDDVKDLDFVFLDGHKYMVVEGSTDLKTKESSLTALLVPFNEEQTEPDHSYPEPPEQQYDDDHSNGYYPDPNDDFDNEDNHPEYDSDPLINWGNEPVDPGNTNGNEDPGDYDYEGEDPWANWV